MINSPRCFAHVCGPFAAAASAAGAAAWAVEREIDSLGADETGIAGGGGAMGAATGAGGGAMAAATGCGAGAGGGTGAAPPNSCRIKSLIGPDRSAPQPGHENRTGSRTISGVTSKAYFAPHWHWIFMGVRV